MNLLNIVHIFIALSLIVLILVQAKGGGLGNAFGGASQNFSTRRGVDRLIFILTIALSFLFLVSSLIQTLVF